MVAHLGFGPKVPDRLRCPQHDRKQCRGSDRGRDRMDMDQRAEQEEDNAGPGGEAGQHETVRPLGRQGVGQSWAQPHRCRH